MGARILNRRPVGNPAIAEMAGADINRRLDRLDAESSKLTQRFIDEGRGNERMSEIAKQTDPLSMKWNELQDEYSALRGEIERRYGPGAPSRLPRGFGPIRRGNVTDRALRYRANADPPPGPKVCRYCGSRRNVEVHHKDGDESNTERSNLAWACRSCNTAIGIEHARRGIGRRTRQYNPSVPTIEQYIYAVKEHTRGAHDEGGKIIHATPKSKRREYAKKIWDARYSAGTDRPSRRATSDSEVPF